MRAWRLYSSARKLFRDARVFKLSGLFIVAVVTTQLSLAKLMVPTAPNNNFPSLAGTGQSQCLVHPPVLLEFNQSDASLQNLTELRKKTTVTVTEITDSTIYGRVQQPTPSKCGSLKRPWWHQLDQLHQRRQMLLERIQFENVNLDNELASFYSSRIAYEIELHQMNCSLPEILFNASNVFMYGLGSNVAVWTQGLCDAWWGHGGSGIASTIKSRVRTRIPRWIWLDQTHCPYEYLLSNESSPWHCYFENVEAQCRAGKQEPLVQMLGPLRCSQGDDSRHLSTSTSEWRKAGTEFLFRHVSPLLLQEAERQIGIVFANNVPRSEERVSVPSNMIVVHVRWGDKGKEMKLRSIDEYILATRQLVEARRERQRPNSARAAKRKDDETVHIYVATEDPEAAVAFTAKADPNWKIYLDLFGSELGAFRRVGPWNHASDSARMSKGRAGLLALGSLFIDPWCGNCTNMVDLNQRPCPPQQ
jgi:hypothetical protein